MLIDGKDVASACYLNNEIYLISGRNNSLEYSTNCEKYNIKEDK